MSHLTSQSRVQKYAVPHLIISRVTSFSRLEACGIVSLLVSPALGSALLSANLGIPFLVSISLFALAFIPVLLLDASHKPDLRLAEPESEPLLQHESTDGEISPPPSTSESHKDSCCIQIVSFGHYWMGLRRPLLGFWESVPKNRRTLLAMAAIFINAMSRASMSFLHQYISKRYHWKLASVGSPLLSPVYQKSYLKRCEI